MLHNEHVIPIILIALLTTTSLAAIAAPNTNAQHEMTPTQTFTTPEQYNKIRLSADGKHIAATSTTTDTLTVFNQTHKLWNTHLTGIKSVAMSENISIIATATITGIQLFNINNPKPQQHYDLDYENPMITLSNDGTTLAYAATNTNQNGTISTTLYQFETATLTPTWHTTLQGTLESLSTSQNGNFTTITTNQPAALHMFTKQQQTPLWTYNFGEHSAAAKISSDGNYIIATGGNQTQQYGLRVHRFTRQSPQPNYIKIISELAPAQRLTVASQGTIFAIAFAETNRLTFFNLDLPPYGYGPGSVLNTTLAGKPTTIAMSSDGKYTAIGTQTGICIFEYINNELTLTKQYTNGNPNITDLAITPDGWDLAATTTSTVCLFNIQEVQNGHIYLWPIIFQAALITATTIAVIYILRRKRKPQKPTNTN